MTIPTGSVKFGLPDGGGLRALDLTGLTEGITVSPLVPVRIPK
jgi:hypothetical protein